MARKSTIKLLLINQSDNESERLISLFRSAGRVARGHRAGSAEELHRLLQNEEWDLIIANDQHPDIDLDQCLAQLEKKRNLTPFIAIRDDQVIETLRAGASDVIATNDEERLILASLRELNHWQQHQQLIATQAKLADAEQRSQLLMSESNQAIAYLADGMLIGCNTQFAKQFGHEDIDELDCLPVMDLIAGSDQERFKDLLKSQRLASDGCLPASDLQVVNSDGAAFPIRIRLNNAVLDDEPCIQITVAEADPQTPAGNHPDVTADPLTTNGISTHHQCLEQITSTPKGALLLIAINNFSKLRSQLSLSGTEQLTTQLADFISNQLEPSQQLSHCQSDSFALIISGASVDQGLRHAGQLFQQIEQHILEVNGQSTHCAVTIGVTRIDGNTSEQILDNAFIACEKARQENNAVASHIAAKTHANFGDLSGDEALDSFLEEALSDQQFSLNYQPVVSLRGTLGDHYEVRTLMANGDEPPQQAEEFLKTFAFDNINTRLDRWILLEATKQLAEKIAAGHDTRLFINLTANTLQDDSLISWFSVALKAGDIPPETVIFQFAEIDINHYLKAAKSFSKAIKALGCKISITHFGKSENPFKSLQHLQPDYVKIDSRFTEAMQEEGDSQVLKAMVGSITENNIEAIISGVANASSLAQLWQLGVDYIQGSYLSEPINEMSYEFTDIA